MPAKSVFVYEHQPGVAVFLYFALRDRGYDPYIAFDPKHFSKSLHGRQYDAFVIAARGPEEPAINLVDTLEARRSSAPLFIINTSGLLFDPRLKNRLTASADVFLDFPVRVRELLQKLDELTGPPGRPDTTIREIDIRKLRMPDILMTPGLLGLSGRMVFRRERIVKSIDIDRGSVTAAGSNQVADRLGNLLLAQGRIDEQSHHKCLLEAQRTEKQLGRIMVERGLLSEDELIGALREQAASIVHSLFLWDSCKFTCETDAVKSETGLPPRLSAAQLTLTGIMRCYQEHRLDEGLPEGGLYLVPNAAAPFRLSEFSLNKDQLILASRIDERTTISRFIESSPCGASQAKALLLALFAAGMVLVADRPAASLSHLAGASHRTAGIEWMTLDKLIGQVPPDQQDNVLAYLNKIQNKGNLG